jgi:hypothetical protein
MSGGTNRGQDRRAQKDSDRVETIIAVGTWIVQNQEPMFAGPLWGMPPPGVTNIKRWVNETDQEVQVRKIDTMLDPRGREVPVRGGIRVPANQTYHWDMWIPWADNPSMYVDHHMTIQVGDQVQAHFWQSRASVRFSVKDAFVVDAPEVPGFSRAGGDRTMVIAKDPQGWTGFALGIYRP